MTDGPTTTDIEEIMAPWNKHITVQDVAHEDGSMAFLRLRIKEGKRYTDLELDPVTAQRLADLMAVWIAKQPAG